jgi:hypothetical protein
MHKRICAVNRVDDPGQAIFARRLAELLADNAVIGPEAGEKLTKFLLGLAIRNSDGRVVFFMLDMNGGLEVAERDPPCLPRSVQGEFQRRLKWRGDCGGVSF